MQELFNSVLDGLHYVEEYPLNVESKYEVYDTAKFAPTPFSSCLPPRRVSNSHCTPQEKGEAKDHEGEIAKEVKKELREVHSKRLSSAEVMELPVKFPHDDAKEMGARTQYPSGNLKADFKYCLVASIELTIRTSQE